MDERRRRWVAATVDKVAGTVDKVEGGRNAALFKAAARLADLPDEGDAPDDRQIADLLTAAADQAGLPKREAIATIRSGIRSGRRNRKGWPAHLAGEHRTAFPGKGTRPPRPTPRPTPRPADPPPTRPPANEVAALWQDFIALDTTADDPGQTFAAALAWLESRQLNVAAVADEDLARVLPNEGGLPRWAGMGTGRRFQSWRESGHLLIVQGWSAAGELESLHARAVGEAERKAIWPFSGPGSARGLVLANEPAVDLLRGGCPEGEVARLVIAEGVPDWLTACQCWHLPVVGIVAGSWTEEMAARIPDGARVVIWTDHDPPGDGYAASVLESFAGRQVEVTRGGVQGADGKPAKGPDGRPMDVNDLFRAGLLPDDPFEGGEPMELSLDARGMRERVRELSRGGKTVRAIAEELGIARGTVSYHMRDMRDGARGTMKSNDMRDGTNLPTEDLPTLALAVESFLDRQRTGAARVFFPWPGGQSDLPPDHAGRTEIPSGALLPAETRPRWEALWRKVGPLWPDRLAVMVGMPGRGKSGFALQVAEAVATAGHPVLYLSAEMGTDELVARLIALRAGGDERDLWGVAWRDVLMGRARREDLEEACAALQESCPALYPWAPQADHRTAGHLQRMAEAVSEARGNAPILVVLDYLQRMAEGDDLRGATRAVSGMLRDLSRPDGIGVGWPGAAVLALSTTARQNYRLMGSVDDLENAYLGPWQTEPNEMKGKGKPKRWRGAPENLEGTGKESGELEADASLLLVLATNTPKKEDAEPEPRKGLVVIPKNRSGSTGMIPFEFYPAPGRFVEPEKVHRSGGRLHETL